jgi:hypothetical protein
MDGGVRVRDARVGDHDVQGRDAVGLLQAGDGVVRVRGGGAFNLDNDETAGG